jgi:uncharacterized protein (TIGR02145 family)
MRKIFSLLYVTIISFAHTMYAQNVGVGTNTPNAALDITSTTNGFLPPRLTYLQRLAIQNPAAGLIVYCTNCGENGEMQYYDGTGWRSMNMGTAFIPPSITSLNCTGALNNGTLIVGNTASGVNSVVSYTDGNGRTYAAQSINSTGVIGLTATLPASTLAIGNSSFTYTISGTPATSGTASFSLSIGGQTCTLNRVVDPENTPHTCGAIKVHNPYLTYGTLKDRDGNNYKTIKIGTQNWMAENLRTTKYRNGTVITNITDQTTWAGLTTGAYCSINNFSATNDCPYGKLYNWYAVNNDNQLCPTGWHVPTDAEWTTLTTFLVGESVAGGKIKNTGTLYWVSPNTGATNSSGFSALPGGLRSNSSFSFLTNLGYWWSATENSTNTVKALARFVTNNQFAVTRYSESKEYGFSVRCLED